MSPAPVFDGHNDTLTRTDHADFAGGRAGGHVDLPRMREGGLRGGVFAIFTPSDDDGRGTDPVPQPDGSRAVPYAGRVSHEHAAAHAAEVAGRFDALERDGHLVIAREIRDVDAAFAPGASGPPVAVMHIEGAEAIDPGLESLGHWYAAGLRSLGPVWSRANDFASGVPFHYPSSPDTGPGLTDAGRALVRACAELGILVDLSHLNEKGFWDVASLEAGPLVASHSGAHAVAAASRNLTDSQLDAIARTGGLVGIVYATQFLRADFANTADTPINAIAEHARYVADRIGPEHVALGSDFDGAVIPGELGDAAGLPRLLDALTAHGFSEEELEGIRWRNWRRVLNEWWKR